MDFSSTLARWRLGHLHSEDLPEIATQWLAEGFDSPALRELAGDTSPIMSNAAPLFERTLTDLDLQVPSRHEALLWLARYYAQKIVNGTLSPHEGAGLIWWEVSNVLEHPSQLILTFVGAVSELDDLPDRTLEDGIDRQEYARELESLIIASAKQLLKETENQWPGSILMGKPNSAES